MRKLILEPLHSEHIIVKISATDLESPFQWKTTEMQEEKNFEWWDILHSIILNMLLSKEKWKYALMFYWADITSKQAQWVRKCMLLANDLPELLLIEQKRRLAIEYWKYLIILSSKFDGMYVRNEQMTLVDVKTSAHKREQEDAESKSQLKIYGFINQISNIERWIFTKDANPKLQVMSFTLDQEQNKKEVMMRIINHIENKYWYVNQWIKNYFI